MIIKPLHVEHIAAVEHLIGLGGPYVWPRTPSDYWLYAELFSSTCPVAFDDQELAGVVIAFRSQSKPNDIYVQDVVPPLTTADAALPRRCSTSSASRPPPGDAGACT